MQKLVKITVSSSHKKDVVASCTMNKSKNHSDEPKIFQQAASQLMERLFCCSSSCPHSQVYETSTEYRTSSDSQQQQQDLNASFLTGNSLLASTTFTEDEHNTSMSSAGLDLMSRSTGDKTLLFSQPQQQSSPHNPHAPGGFLFLDGSASPPSSVRRRHHQRHGSHNSLSSTSLSIGTPPQHVYDTFAVLQRNETATTASVSSDDDMTQPSQIPAIQSSQTFDDDDGDNNNEYVEDGVWNDHPMQAVEPTHHFVTPSKATACTSPIPSLSALRAAKQKSKQLTRDNLDVRRVQAEFSQRSPHTKEPQFPC